MPGVMVCSGHVYPKTELHFAAARGSLAEVKRLLKEGSSLKKDAPLVIASNNGRIKVVQELLAANADINGKNASGLTALHRAADNGNVRMVKVLLRYQPNVNIRCASGNTALMRLMSCKSRTGVETCTQLLLEAGTDIKLRNIANQTAKDIAMKKRPELISIFTEVRVLLLCRYTKIGFFIPDDIHIISFCL
jgi:ankyrin repeat protein